jgi:hypothetical protein
MVLAGESAATAYVGSGGADRRHEVDVVGGIVVEATSATDGLGPVSMQARAGGRQLQLTFAVLPGGTPPAFGVPYAVRAASCSLPSGWPEPLVLGDHEWPRLQIDAAAAPGPEFGCCRDRGIALMHLPAGTDLEDFVLGAGASNSVLLQPPNGCIAIPGHLWIAPGDTPLVVELRGDVTIAVTGNLYLGRTLRVVGVGCLTIATRTEGGVAFADVDGNGRWSAGDRLCSATEFSGPQEGVGNAYLGLPRGGPGELQLDAGLLIDGHLHVGVDRAVVHGPLLLAAGASAMPGRAARLETAGRRLPPLQRSVLPGFMAVGAPRPSLVRVAAPGQEALYLSMPSR